MNWKIQFSVNELLMAFFPADTAQYTNFSFHFHMLWSVTTPLL